MKNISHTRVIDNSTNVVVDEINRRAKTQSRWYRMLFMLFGLLVLLYIFFLCSTTRYDGFIVSKNAAVRHVSNTVVVDYWVEPGDVVCEGDTLYSYINVDQVRKISDPYTVFETDSRKWNAEYRRNTLWSEYVEYERVLDSMQYVIERAQKDIEVGVATKEFLENLQWQKIQIYEEMEHINRLINQEQSIVNSSGSNFDLGQRIDDMGAYTNTFRRQNPKFFGSAYKYRIAYVDMVIVDLNARHGVLSASEENILTYMPYNTPDMLDLHINMLLTPSEFSKVEEGMLFDAYVGNDLIGEVVVTYASTYIKNGDTKRQVGEEYEYSHDNKEIIVRAEFVDEDIKIGKYQVDGFPVILKRFKLDRRFSFSQKEQKEEIEEAI